MRKKYNKKEVLTAFLFLLPTFAVFLMFNYYPLVDSLRISFTSWKFYGKPKYIGFQNYINILKNKTFWKILLNTLHFAFFSTLISVLLGLFLAIILFGKNGKFGKGIKTLLFIPNITTASAIAILWIWIFNPVNGLMEIIYSAFGSQSPQWLLDAKYAKWAIISLSVWRNFGYAMTIYIAGLALISDSVYESATIDGATTFYQAIKIKIPLLRPSTIFLSLTTFIQNMKVFDIVQVMTAGGPSDSTNVLNLYIYQQAFISLRAGYGAALSVIQFALLLIITIIQRRVTKDDGGLYD